MSGKITDLTAVGVAIDRANDVLEIVHSNASYNVTPNNLTGITGGSVVSTSDSQSLSNKTIGNSNTITVKAANLTIQDGSDATKQAQFVASGITAGNTRSYTLPDASGTVVLTAATQTLTSKTITSPTITGGTIDNTTITVDSISGHTTPTIVTIGGLQISSGVVGSNGVATASITDAAVTPAKLIAGTGTGWATASYTPTFSNFTIGNGTVSGTYLQVGKFVFAEGVLTLGSTSSTSGQVIMTLPVTAASRYSAAYLVGYFHYYNSAGNAYYPGNLYTGSTTTVGTYFLNAAGTYTVWQFSSATIPATWAVNDKLFWQLRYEAP